LPDLKSVQLNGACNGSIKGFKGSKDFRVELSGASKINGDIDTDQLDIVASGASKATLKGTAKDAKIQASGASHFDLDDLKLSNAVVNFSGASSGTVHVDDKLDYNLSGASHLDYHGNPTIGEKDTSGASSAKQK
jgi:hypothetical protein